MTRNHHAWPWNRYLTLSCHVLSCGNLAQGVCRHSRLHARLATYTAKLETPEAIEKQLARIDRAFTTIRDQVRLYKPDVIVYVGDDQGDMFNESNNPTFSVFTGAEAWGATVPRYVEQPLEDSHLSVPVHTDLAKRILNGLVERGFDPSNLGKMQPLGNPKQGMSHMLIHPHPRIVPDNDIPVVPFF